MADDSPFGALSPSDDWLNAGGAAQPNPLGVTARTLGAYKKALLAPGTAVASPESNVFDVALRPGVIPPSNQPFADHLQDLAQDYEGLTGEAPTVVSGQRSLRDQMELKANQIAGAQGKPLPYPARGPVKMAAAPGTSSHERGLAADVSVHQPGVLDSLAAEPWRGITPGSTFGDPGHYQASGGPGRSPAGPAPPPSANESSIAARTPPAAGTSPSASPSAPKSPLQALATLGLMQSLWPHLDIQPVNYNPFAVQPHHIEGT